MLQGKEEDEGGMLTLVFSTFSLSVPSPAPALGIYLPLAACLLYIVNDRWRKDALGGVYTKIWQ